MDYSPWGSKEMDTTERLTHIHVALSSHSNILPPDPSSNIPPGILASLLLLKHTLTRPFVLVVPSAQSAFP